MTEMTVLICSHGERHEDCIPEYFITLSEENFKKVSKNVHENIPLEIDPQDSGSEEYNHPCYEFYVYVLIPNKPVCLDFIRDCDLHIGFGLNCFFYDGDQISYQLLESKIRGIYEKKLSLKNV